MFSEVIVITTKEVQKMMMSTDPKMKMDVKMKLDVVCIQEDGDMGTADALRHIQQKIKVGYLIFLVVLFRSLGWFHVLSCVHGHDTQINTHPLKNISRFVFYSQILQFVIFTCYVVLDVFNYTYNLKIKWLNRGAPQKYDLFFYPLFKGQMENKYLLNY